MAEMRLPVAVLREDAENPRTITPEALDGLKLSAEEFGDLAGIVWNEQTGELVCGHQRMRALRDAGASEWVRDGVTGVIVHPKTGERFSVRVVSWDRERQRMANLVANSPLIAGEFTAAALEQIRNLEDQALAEALRLTDLEQKLAEEFGGEDDLPADGNTDPDSVPATPAEPITKRGDVWILGDHRLMCGDSTDEPGDVDRLLGGERPALALHDPPYGIGIVAGETARLGNIGDGRQWGSAAAPRGSFVPIEGDDEPFDPRPLLDSGEVVVLWGANHYADRLPARASWLVWDKRDGMPSNDFSDCELAWVSTGSSARLIRHMWNGMIRASERGEPRVHPTQKPVAVYEQIIGEHTVAGDVVYDGFGGSGTTVLACERLRRVARVMELSPAYCDVIVARWEEFTGRKAIRADQPTPDPRAVRANGESDEGLPF